MSIKKDKYLDIPVFDGDDGIKYIRYDDLCLILKKMKANIEKKEKEIERLNKDKDDLQNRFNSLMEAHKISDEENERLNNIIKQAREYIYLHSTSRKFYINEIDKINEIIDKLNEGDK